MTPPVSRGRPVPSTTPGGGGPGWSERRAATPPAGPISLVPAVALYFGAGNLHPKDAL